MVGGSDVLVLKGAHVIDPAQGIDRVTDVTIADGKIAAIGDGTAPAGARTLDLAGTYLTPGWVDIHIHVYGTLGFGDPDSIGIYQGVTTYVDAGGTGIGSLDEYMAMLQDKPDRLVTSLYAGPQLYPMGIVGLAYVFDDVRDLKNVPIAKWMDWHTAHPGVLRYLKISAFSPLGRGAIHMGKGVADMLGIPLYVHIGESKIWPGHPNVIEDAFRIAEAGDIITHIYHNNIGCILDKEAKVLPFVREAQERGVLFDIGFGGYNFDWDVAEKAYAQGVIPHFISSDLQQFNVMKPCKSLANVMGIFLKIGMSLTDIVERVTWAGAKALSLTDVAGSLKVGQPADITVFRVDKGTFQFSDCYSKTRTGDQQVVPVMAFKTGQRFDCDMERARDERNWFVQIAEDYVPPAAERLSRPQIKFLAGLCDAIETMEWEVRAAQDLDVDKAVEIQTVFNGVLKEQGLPLRDGLMAVLDCFIENPFNVQIGFFLVRLERSFVIQRLNEVVGQQAVAAE